MKTNQNKKLEQITPKTLIVGMDMAKENHYARITDYRGKDLINPIKINNSKHGFENLLVGIERLKEKHEADKVIIGMEPSGHYWRVLGWRLKIA